MPGSRIPGGHGYRRGRNGDVQINMEEARQNRRGLAEQEQTHIAHVADFDAHVINYDAHVADLYAHGWTVLTDKAIVTGTNSIAHGLGSKPTQVVPIKDLAVPCFVEVYRSAALNLVNSVLTVIPFDTEVHDWGGIHSAGVVTLPHTGIYALDANCYINSALTAGTLTYTRFSGSASGNFHGSYIREPGGTHMVGQAENPSLISGETMSWSVYQSGAAPAAIRTGRDDIRMTIRSDDNWSEGVHDATNLTIWSARTRTMSFLVR